MIELITQFQTVIVAVLVGVPISVYMRLNPLLSGMLCVALNLLLIYYHPLNL